MSVTFPCRRRRRRRRLLDSPKTTFRLAVGYEHLKKIFSANSEAPLSVQSIMNDIDTSSKLSRDAHEEFAAPVLDHIALALRQTPAESGVSIDACAFFSPTFRIQTDPDNDTGLVVFFRGNAIPSTKVLTCYRKGPFGIEACRAELQGLLVVHRANPIGPEPSESIPPSPLPASPCTHACALASLTRPSILRACTPFPPLPPLARPAPARHLGSCHAPEGRTHCKERPTIRTGGFLGMSGMKGDADLDTVRRQRAEQAIEDREDNEEEGATPAPRRLARARTSRTRTRVEERIDLPSATLAHAPSALDFDKDDFRDQIRRGCRTARTNHHRT
ncbi:hypothetical protein V8E55_006729 [Tylopilus felleus]